MFQNSVAAALHAVGLGDLIVPKNHKKGRIPKPKYRVIGESKVPHFYNRGRLVEHEGRLYRPQKLIRKIGPQAAANHPDLQQVTVQMVTVKRVQRI